MAASPDQRAALAAEFPPEAVRSFRGRGNHEYDYIEDETVMDRLDDVLGVGNWTIEVDPVGTNVARVVLTVRFGDEWVTYQDFGYPNQTDGDVLKECVSDGIRRCGRYLGIGRYLYRKHDSPHGAPRATSGDSRPTQARSGPAVAAPSVAAGEPDEFAAVWSGVADPVAAARPEDPRDGHYGPTCPVHIGRAWRDTTRGPKCTANDGTRDRPDWCTWFPSRRWLAEQEMVGR